MGSQYIPPPEQNVVNVGDEISINALNGIAQANPAITSTNPVATDNSVATAVSGKANLSGAAFTGNISASSHNISARRIIGQPNAGVAGVNIGIGGDSTNSTTAGDIWIATGGASLNFRDGMGSWRQCISTSSAAAITTTAVNPVLTLTNNGNGGGLRVVNVGSGDSFRVEDDNANPDQSPFVINSDGKVGIGGVVPVSANHKVAVHNGSIVFTSGYGVAFGDGSSITSATTLSSAVVQAAINTMFSGNQFLANGGTGPIYASGPSFTYESGYDSETANPTYNTIGGGEYIVGSYNSRYTYWSGSSFEQTAGSNAWLPVGHLIEKAQYTVFDNGAMGATYWYAIRSNGSGSYTIDQNLENEPF